MWEDGECWVIGGGPSMPRQFGVPEDMIADIFDCKRPLSEYSSYLSPIHKKHVIGVNAAFLIGTWMDVAFFGDGKFFFSNRRELISYPKLRISCNPNIQNRKEAVFIKHVLRDGSKRYGLTKRRGRVSWNHNSGGAAINLATQFGAKRIILLGFDMNLDKNNRQHWHSKYKSSNRKNINEKALPFQRHLKCFPMIAADAKRQGVEILNVSPDSAIKEFRKVRLNDLL